MEGKALKLHPLVCTAYNADFDGDQMAIHLPLSAEAQAEARFLMLAANNLLKPSDGKPVAVPSQDMILGAYYLTMIQDGAKGEGKVFRDYNEALMAYQAGVVDLHAKIKVRITKKVGDHSISKIIDTTVGRMIFNEPIPQDLGFVDRTKSENEFNLEIDFLVKKKQIGQIVDRCIRVHGTAMTSEVLDNIKALGYKYSTRSAITVAVCDATVPPQKVELIRQAEDKVLQIQEEYEDGFLSDDQRYGKVLETWNDCTDKVTEELQAGLTPDKPHLYDGRLWRSWLHCPDSSAGRYAWLDCQHRRSNH